MTDEQGKQQQKLVRALIILNANSGGIIHTDTNLLALMIPMVDEVAIINANNIIQATSLKSKTNTKKVNALLMGFKGFALARVIRLYAVSIANEALEASVTYSFTDITIGTPEELLARNEIVQAAAANITAMIAATFRVVTTDPAAYNTLITNWNSSVPSWSNAISLRVAATLAQKVSYSNIVKSYMPELKKFLTYYNNPATLAFYNSMMNSIKGIGTATQKLRSVFLFRDAETGAIITKIGCTLTLDMIP